MNILAYNNGHDGTVVLLENGVISHALEGEKDDGQRHAPVSPDLFVRSLQAAVSLGVVALSGSYNSRANVEAGYFGVESAVKTDTEGEFLGRPIRRFSTSHERSHIMCSYGLSPFPQGQPCYVLVWEGRIGAFYHVDEHVSIQKVGEVLAGPGSKYSLLYALADPAVPHGSWPAMENAGKLMALAAYGRRGTLTAEQRTIVELVLSFDEDLRNLRKQEPFTSSMFCNIGVDSQEFKDLAWHFSNTLFDRYYRFARDNLQKNLPLLISGGCGLNCDWNSQWKESGLFSDVFVPPCANDSGVALGAAVDALHHHTRRAKVQWDVYSGEPFIEDVPEVEGFDRVTLNLAEVSRQLLKGDIIGWAQGRYEMGPRALGNRSLLAAPFSAHTRDRLNMIKQRESFRPIAPICLEEDFGCHFEHHGPSPHMLYFQQVKNAQLAAITHIDGSARVQSVNDEQNPLMCSLLREFRKQSGVGVLCNTSLNFKSRGFINRLSQLVVFARDRGLDGFVAGGHFWRRSAQHTSHIEAADEGDRGRLDRESHFEPEKK